MTLNSNTFSTSKEKNADMMRNMPSQKSSHFNPIIAISLFSCFFFPSSFPQNQTSIGSMDAQECRRKHASNLGL
jgi:hypothetical protein